jgi:hypothetical protein
MVISSHSRMASTVFLHNIRPELQTTKKTQKTQKTRQTDGHMTERTLSFCFFAKPWEPPDDAEAATTFGADADLVNPFFFFSAAIRPFWAMNKKRSLWLTDVCGFPFASGALSPEFLLPSPMHQSRLCVGE